MRMSTNLFLDTFSITNSKIMNQITERFNSFTDSIVSASLEVDTNATIKQLLQKEHETAISKYGFYYQMTHEMNRIFAEVDPNDANMVILSNQQDIFNMNYIKWQVDGEKLANHEIIDRVRESENDIVYQFEQSEVTNGTPMVIASKALKLQTNEIYGYLFFSLTEPDSMKVILVNNVLLLRRRDYF